MRRVSTTINLILLLTLVVVVVQSFAPAVFSVRSNPLRMEKGAKNGDETLPFFLRDDLPEPAPAPAFGKVAIDNALDIASTLTQKASEVAGAITEEAGKIDWDEVKGNVDSFVKSDEVRNLKEATVSRRTFCDRVFVGL